MFIMDIAREADMEILAEQLKHATSGQRPAILKAMYNIRNEDRVKKSMREALIKAHRYNDLEALKDIREFIQHKQRYLND